MNRNILILLVVLVVGVAIGVYVTKGNFSSLRENIPIACVYKGQTYKHKQNFSDDCNSCSCVGGQVQCTAMACEPPAF